MLFCWGPHAERLVPLYDTKKLLEIACKQRAYCELTAAACLPAESNLSLKYSTCALSKFGYMVIIIDFGPTRNFKLYLQRTIG